MTAVDDELTNIFNAAEIEKRKTIEVNIIKLQIQNSSFDHTFHKK